MGFGFLVVEKSSVPAIIAKRFFVVSKFGGSKQIECKHVDFVRPLPVQNMFSTKTIYYPFACMLNLQVRFAFAH
jgi:hypothetical protein